jgi:hypothetical protein
VNVILTFELIESTDTESTVIPGSDIPTFVILLEDDDEDTGVDLFSYRTNVFFS